MKWQLESRSIDEVYPNVKNPRTMDKEQAQALENSIEKFGLCQPIVLNGSGAIIGGNQRVATMRALGFEFVDVYVPQSPLTQEEEEELGIILNKISGEWDFDILANDWELASLIEYGFSPKELGLEPDEERKKPPRKFILTIQCEDEIQLELIEEQVAQLVEQCEGVRYKVKIK